MTPEEKNNEAINIGQDELRALLTEKRKAAVRRSFVKK